MDNIKVMGQAAEAARENQEARAVSRGASLVNLGIKENIEAYAQMWRPNTQESRVSGSVH